MDTATLTLEDGKEVNFKIGSGYRKYFVPLTTSIFGSIGLPNKSEQKKKTKGSHLNGFGMSGGDAASGGYKTYFSIAAKQVVF